MWAVHCMLPMLVMIDAMIWSSSGLFTKYTGVKVMGQLGRAFFVLGNKCVGQQ